MLSTGWLTFGQIIFRLIMAHFRAFLDDEQRRHFGDVVGFFKENVDPLSKDLAFLLGERTI